MYALRMYGRLVGDDAVKIPGGGYPAEIAFAQLTVVAKEDGLFSVLQKGPFYLPFLLVGLGDAGLPIQTSAGEDGQVGVEGGNIVAGRSLPQQQ